MVCLAGVNLLIPVSPILQQYSWYYCCSTDNIVADSCVPLLVQSSCGLVECRKIQRMYARRWNIKQNV